MSHRDSRTTLLAGNASALQQALKLLVGTATFATVLLRRDCSWTPQSLSMAAILWACSGEPTLTARWAQARRIAPSLVPGHAPVSTSYQAFIKLLTRWTADLLAILLPALRTQIRSTFPDLYLLYGFVVFATDGSRIDLPRTKSHEAVYTPAKYRNPQRKPRRSKGKGKKARRSGKRRKPVQRRSTAAARARQGSTPLMWITTLWHVTTGLPWNWRLGPSDSSERAHLSQMLPSFPENSLVIGDAGFVGIEFLKSILDAGQDLLVRVGSNVRLLRKLGVVRENSQTVYLWPSDAAKRGQPPLVLRLVVLHNGRHPVYLVTSVLSTKRLSDKQIGDLYHRRWGIELYYRHLKQTFGRGKLRSHNAENAEIEMHWSMLGLGTMLLNGVREVRGDDEAANRLSVSAVLKAFRGAMTYYQDDPEPGKSLRNLLQAALIDTYERANKASRNYPRKRQAKPAGSPLISDATVSQRDLASDLCP